ncbi:helix-turn-helix domain-containing protein [Dactylosporangium sp. NPDC049140]|jgi:AcrR family transcriptional regulator|uniref:TetR/AcrR family transcriptional regulator n=1 Tax=Dactylosporangium sp. NPDC049140 TaxID=3155647 RepID=UPI0033D2395E
MLREEKKARARAAMADAAAALFAEHGYDGVAMTQVARAAGVSEQTLYNYFPTKESLVFDQADAFEATMLATLAGRGPDGDLLDAYRRWLDAFLLGPAARRAVENPGGMVRLVAGSDALRRALLDLAHHVAGALGPELERTAGYAPAAATALADGLVAVFVRTVERLGAAPNRRAVPAVTRRAHEALDALRPLVHSRS